MRLLTSNAEGTSDLGAVGSKYPWRRHRSNPAVGPVWEDPANVLSVTPTFSAPLARRTQVETPVTLKVPWGGMDQLRLFVILR
jgi:hypothetical protein